MKRVIVFLLCGLFMASVCVAQTHAFSNGMIGDKPTTDPKATKGAAGKAIDDANKPKPPEGGQGYLGPVPAAQAARIAAKTPVNANVALPANIQSAVDSVIGPARAGFTRPTINVMKTADMEGLPAFHYNGVVYYSEETWKARQALAEKAAHEYMEAFCAQNNVEGGHELSEQVGQMLLTSLNNEQLSAIHQDIGTAVDAVEMASQTANAPKGQFYSIKVSSKVSKAVAEAYGKAVAAKLGLPEDAVEVKQSLGENMGDVVVAIYPSKTDTTNALGTCRVDVKSGEVFRSTGLINLAFIGANIPDNVTAADRPLVAAWNAQAKAIAADPANAPQLPPNPTQADIQSKLRITSITLPAAAPANYNKAVEDQKAAEIFAEAA